MSSNIKNNDNPSLTDDDASVVVVDVESAITNKNEDARETMSKVRLVSLIKRSLIEFDQCFATKYALRIILY